MKNVSAYFRLIALLLLSVATVHAQSVTRTFTRSFNMTGINSVFLDLPGTVEVNSWDNPTLRFEITVQMPDGTSPSMLEELVRIGRYNLSLVNSEGQSTVSAPNLKRQLKAKGLDIKEQVSFNVYAPKKLEPTLPAPSGVVEASPKQ